MKWIGNKEGWVEGRQGTGYLRKALIFGSFFDLQLLKFPEGSYIPEHSDPVIHHRHYRINLILKNAIGGDFKCENTIFKINKFLYFFRPDLEKHSVSMIEKGTRYVLSFGFTKRIKT